MRNNRFFDIMVGVTLIPLWIALLTRFFEKYPWLFYLATAITTVLVLIILVSLISDLLRKNNVCYIFDCRRMDALVLRTRKKLQKTIARTNDVNIMDYALEKLREITPPDIYSRIISELSGKEQNLSKSKALLFYKNPQTGEAK